MIKNFFVITIRNLFKNGIYSVVNIVGLSVGLMCSLLILLWVSDEVSFDRFLPNSESLYQVWVNAEFDGEINSWSSVPLPTYDEMKTVNSNIKNSVVAGWGNERLLVAGVEKHYKRGYWVSEEFLEMFQFPLVAGDASIALDDPSSIVITESLAKILFGDTDPINQTITVEEESELKVTAVVKDLPENSSFQFEYLIPWKQREAIQPFFVEERTNWGNYSYQVFVELHAGASETEVEASIRNILEEKGQDDIAREFFLHPMPRWRLYSYFENGKEAGGRIDYVSLFAMIAIFVLILACINFMNLATARSERRAREVGVRKSLGSSRLELVFQFIGESTLITFISFVVALGLAQLLLPSYNTLVEKSLVIPYSSVLFWQYGAIVILTTGFLSGSYPAFFLSAFKPVSTLKGKISVSKGASTPRKVLVVFQFGFAIFLMIGTIVIFNQTKLLKNRDLGYQQDKLISVPFNNEMGQKYELIKSELLRSGAVEGVTRSNSAITQINSNNFVGWPGKPEDLRVIFTTIATEYDYASTMGIEVVMGRDFSKDYPSDSMAIVINKAALEVMQIEDPIGVQLDLWGGKRTVVGVVDDVLMGEAFVKVKPMFMVILPDWTNYVTIRLAANQQIEHSLATVKSVFAEYNGSYPFDYEFVDVAYQRKFTTINLTQSIASLFAFLAMIITGLGLFGLASYTAEQRIKEIGIRKVLGASVAGLVALMSRDFSKLVLISFVVAAPVAWLLLENYLDRYPIRTEIAWWIFPAIGLAALVFALIIIVHQARKAATSNPVQALRADA